MEITTRVRSEIMDALNNDDRQALCIALCGVMHSVNEKAGLQVNLRFACGTRVELNEDGWSAQWRTPLPGQSPIGGRNGDFEDTEQELMEVTGFIHRFYGNPAGVSCRVTRK